MPVLAPAHLSPAYSSAVYSLTGRFTVRWREQEEADSSGSVGLITHLRPPGDRLPLPRASTAWQAAASSFFTSLASCALVLLLLQRYLCLSCTECLKAQRNTGHTSQLWIYLTKDFFFFINGRLQIRASRFLSILSRISALWFSSSTLHTRCVYFFVFFLFLSSHVWRCCSSEGNLSEQCQDPPEGWTQ